MAKLRQLRTLGISGLTKDSARAFCYNIQEFVHLEFLSLQAKDRHEILNLQTVDSSILPCLRVLVLKGRLQRLPNWIEGLQNLRTLCLSLSRFTDDPLTQLSRLPSLVSLWLYQAYEGERLCFVKDGFQRLKHLVLNKLPIVSSIEVEDSGLSLLEELRVGQNQSMNRVPSGIQRLGNLKVLTNYEMPRAFVQNMQPDGGLDYWKVDHVKSVLFLYKIQGKGYKLFKLGDSGLLDHLNQHDLELNFCRNEEEEEEEDDDFHDISSSLSRSILRSKNTSQWSFNSTYYTDDLEE